jgi:alpha-acetolactate decarboxylase
MTEKEHVEKGHFGIGHLKSSPEEHQRIAKESMRFNMSHKEFKEVFPDWACKYGKTTDPENACKS